MSDQLANLRSVFAASPNAVLLIGEDGEIRMTNPRLDQLFGYEPGELIGQRVEVLVPEAVREHHPELREAFFRLPSPREMGMGRDLFGVAKDGHLIPLEIGLSPFETGQGTCVLASLLDITARKLQDEKLRLAIDAASSAMIMIDSRGSIVLTNRQACETFGYADGELIGKPVETLVPDRFRRRHAVYRTSFARLPRRRKMGEGSDLYGCRKDGSEFPLEIGLTPIAGHDGEFVMSTIHDISERRLQEQRMADHNAELGRLNEELSQFAYSASHDLKAPLTTISGLLHCAVEDLEAEQLGDVQVNIDRALELSDHLARRVEDVLCLARSDGQHEMTREGDLKSVINEIEQQLSSSIEQNDVRFEVKLRHREPVVTEPSRLLQILQNLVENAVRYADSGKAERFVRVETASDAGGLCVDVVDNGIGIPRKRHGEVFKMFKRFGNHRLPGSGLGLALVHKHVQRLGGSIAFESTPGGTVFHVILPASGGTWPV